MSATKLQQVKLTLPTEDIIDVLERLDAEIAKLSKRFAGEVNANYDYDVVSTTSVEVRVSATLRVQQYLQDFEESFYESEVLEDEDEEEEEIPTRIVSPRENIFVGLKQELEHASQPHLKSKFSALAEEWNLTPLLELARKMGIRVFYSELPGTSYCHPDVMGHSIVVLKQDHRWDGAGLLPALAHELGHLVAYQENEDYKDEVLAWEIGEELYRDLYGKSPDPDFVEVREFALQTYS